MFTVDLTDHTVSLRNTLRQWDCNNDAL